MTRRRSAFHRQRPQTGQSFEDACLIHVGPAVRGSRLAFCAAWRGRVYSRNA
jgi:hypothetical protein